jgi:hypothetical protein
MTRHKPPIDEDHLAILAEAIWDLRLLADNLAMFHSERLPEEYEERFIARFEARDALVGLFAAAGIHEDLANIHAEEFLRHFVRWWW